MEIASKIARAQQQWEQQKGTIAVLVCIGIHGGVGVYMYMHSNRQQKGNRSSVSIAMENNMVLDCQDNRGEQ